MLVGEMRDLETIEAALTIAETGHLVFATLHTNSAIQSDQPHHRRVPAAPAVAGARAALVRARGRDERSCSCRAPSGPGRVLALEVMVPNAAIRNLIREDKVHQIYSQMQVGQSEARHADAQPVARTRSTRGASSPSRKHSVARTTKKSSAA